MHPTPLFARLGAGLMFFLAAAISIFAQTAPTITAPSSQTIEGGQGVTFYVNAGGYPSPSILWQRLPVGSGTWVNLSDTGAYSGTTTYAFTIGLATLGMNGDQFRATATNTAGSATSSAALLTVNPAVAPQIFGLSSAITVNSGTNLYLSPSVSGSLPMTYQWKKGGVNISDATSSYFYKNQVTTADNGEYTLAATNYAGTTTSSAVNVTVNPAVAPALFNLPASLTINYGDTLNLSPSVAGTQPITYQWKKDGVNVSGATDVSFYKYGVTTADGGSYTLTATNSAGTVTSSAVTVTVNPAVAPVILNMPTSLTVGFGEAFTLYPSAVLGTQPITFQWKKDGVNIAGETSSSYYKYSGVTTADSGSYTLTATNSAGTVTSSAVVLTVNAALAPVISNLPYTLTVNYGEAFYFYPSVGGSQTITYQWKKDGVLLANATSNYFYKGGAVAADAGAYTLTATNPAGTVISSAIIVTVNPAVAPEITNLPTPFTVAYGASISINPTITGTVPITYQWKRNGVAISGATASNYSKYSGVTTADSGDYTLTATNSVGTVTSSGVTVTVSPPVAPAITNMPATITVSYGTSLYINPIASGTQPITYQWKKDGVSISGATSSSYAKYSNITPADNGSYTLTATNLVGTVTSSAVTVTVNPAVAPEITNLPATLTVGYGIAFSITPTITGTQPITYQWEKDGVLIPNGTSSVFAKYSDVTTLDSGVYRLTATNSAGSVTSAAVTVTVNAAVAPVIYNLPPSLSLNYGNSLNLSPSIGGTQPMTYQWLKDGVAVPNGISSSYSKGGVTPADSGSYTLVVTNVVGVVTSSAVSVTVNAAVGPAIYNLPAAVTVDYGSSLNLSPSYGGSEPMTYQWKKGGVNVLSGASSTYSKGNVTTADSGLYTVTVVNPVGTVTSSTVAVTVNPAVAPGIYNLPATPLTLNYGSSLSLSPSITGTLPMTYQWKKDGVALTNGTFYYYNDGYMTTAESGLYTLEVTNVAGTTTSSSVTVTVSAPVAPTIIQQPVSLVTTLGLAANFSVTATGTNPITYQWYLDGQLITDAIYSTLVIPDVQAGDVGSYTVVVTTPAGSVTSTAATISINSLGVLAASAGSYSSYLIKSDGTLWGTGYNNYGNLGDGTTTGRLNPIQISSNVVSVESGYEHALFIKTDGTLWAMGNNAYGQLGDGTFISRYSPVLIATDVVAIAAGNFHSLYIKADGTLWAMGINVYGQLGDGTFTSRSNPVQIATEVLSVSAGSYHSLFVKMDGTLRAMGYNVYGQLGDGTSASRNSPVQVATAVLSVSAGGEHSLFVKLDGTLWATGYNVFGQLGDGTAVSRSSPVPVATAVQSASAGDNFSLLVKLDGTLWAMGNNSAGQLGDGTTFGQVSPKQITTGVGSAAAGGSHGLFLTLDSALWAMGNSYYGQLGDGTSNYYANPPKRILSGMLSVPGAPAVATASGTATGTGIQLTWSPTLAATRYEIWRSTSNSSATATQIAGSVPIPLYYDLTAVVGTTYYYWIKATNPAGTSAFSTTANITAGTPSITTQPVNRNIEVGSAVTFTVTASGTPTPTYQWQRNGVNISGATSSSYTITSVTSGDAGSYTVVATNSNGTVTSAAAVLTTYVVAPSNPIITITVE